ncbi:D-alanyl-D-alanine dipeptidase [Candidatus Arthromitus sp. SFB-2]|nr:D-alanyl-D-alanine dipeptidase [Candidatus Arthromitus sp. SFB-2]
MLSFGIILISGGLYYTHESLAQIDKKIMIKNFENTKEYSYNYDVSINGLRLLNSFHHEMILDIRYASKNNFTHKVLYDADACILQESTLKKIIRRTK